MNRSKADISKLARAIDKQGFYSVVRSNYIRIGFYDWVGYIYLYGQDLGPGEVDTTDPWELLESAEKLAATGSAVELVEYAFGPADYIGARDFAWWEM